MTAFTRILYALLDVVEVLLGLRFVLRLLGANPGNTFMSFLMRLTEPLIFPFRGIFNAPAVDGSVLEWVTLTAMIVYAVLALIIVRLLRGLLPSEHIEEHVETRHVREA